MDKIETEYGFALLLETWQAYQSITMHIYNGHWVEQNLCS